MQPATAEGASTSSSTLVSRPALSYVYSCDESSQSWVRHWPWIDSLTCSSIVSAFMPSGPRSFMPSGPRYQSFVDI